MAQRSKGASATQSAEEFLASEAVVEITKPRQLAEFRARLESDPQRLERALQIGLIALLREDGLIDESEARDLTVATSKSGFPPGNAVR